mmetsp:Transcript_6381/g.18673  ORF Transcript_6381/g.18673 Transcript_6381/m.18673 type:complete len:211 (-) Transcript_6381:3053-3685(-)
MVAMASEVDRSKTITRGEDEEGVSFSPKKRRPLSLSVVMHPTLLPEALRRYVLVLVWRSNFTTELPAMKRMISSSREMMSFRLNTSMPKMWYNDADLGLFHTCSIVGVGFVPDFDSSGASSLLPSFDASSFSLASAILSSLSRGKYQVKQSSQLYRRTKVGHKVSQEQGVVGALIQARNEHVSELLFHCYFETDPDIHCTANYFEFRKYE